MEVAPIVVSRLVAASPRTAFVAFTTRMGTWWDPKLTPDPSTYDGVHIDSRIGGTVSLIHEGSDPYPIGMVTEWVPNLRYAQTFTLALDDPTILSIDFVPEDDGTLVVLTHRGWGPGNADQQAKFNEWPRLLERYAKVAESED